MARVLIRYLLLLGSAVATSACDSQVASAPDLQSSEGEPSTVVPPVAKPADPADRRYASIKGHPWHIAENGQLVPDPPKTPAIPPVDPPIGFNVEIKRDTEAALQQKFASAVAQQGPPRVAALIANARPLQESDLKPADRAYLSEVAARAGELDALAPDIREQRKAEIKRRHLGE